MAFHLHFADRVWAANIEAVWHVVTSDEIPLHVHLDVHEASHVLTSQGPWSAVPSKCIHILEDDSVELLPILGIYSAIHYHIAKAILPSLFIDVDSTDHIHRVDGPWMTYVYPTSTFHRLFDDMYREPGNEIHLDAPVVPVGSVEQTLPSLFGYGFGNNTAYITLPTLEASATGDVGLVGSVEADLPIFTLATRSGARAWATLPGLDATATGFINAHGSVVATLPHMWGSAVGSNSGSATSSNNLPALKCNATGSLGIVGSVDVDLPRMILNAIGAGAGVIGSVTDDLPFLRGSATGFHTPEGSVDVDLPTLELIAVGTNNTSRFCSNILRHER